MSLFKLAGMTGIEPVNTRLTVEAVTTPVTYQCECSPVGFAPTFPVHYWSLLYVRLRIYADGEQIGSGKQESNLMFLAYEAGV